jgi:hypothetical protein
MRYSHAPGERKGLPGCARISRHLLIMTPRNPFQGCLSRSRVDERPLKAGMRT